MEYIKLHLNSFSNYVQPTYLLGSRMSIQTSSDNMSNLWEFITHIPCFENPWRAEVLNAMKKKEEYKLIFNDIHAAINVIGINKVILYDYYECCNDAKIILPFDILCNLTKKYFEIDDDKIKELLITYDPKTEVFEMSIKYIDGKEEHFKFESEYKEINKTKR